jgi:hypothetical protein
LSKIVTDWIKAFLVLLLLSPVLVSAHHGRGEFFGGQMYEIEGEVAAVLWRNPHVMVTVQSEGPDGTEVLWQLEGSDAGTLARRGLTDEHIKVGDLVRAVGRKSDRRGHWLATAHILLPNGTEMIFGRDEPRWSGDYIGGDQGAETMPIQDSVEPDGIFRVWIRDTGGTPYDVLESPPLTPEALSAYESYDPLRDDPVLDCVIPGMPRVMTVVGSRPIEFRRQRDDILLHSENFNLTRIIHMTGEGNANEESVSPLGYSQGQWDGNTLIVTTTRISWHFFDLPPLIGIPQSRDIEIVERFVLNEDEDKLVYDFWANDPVNFTAPIEKENFMTWGWQPGEVLRTDNCIDYVDVP